jgi:hypothetical protein
MKIIIFTKFPENAQVKSRISIKIGQEMASKWHSAMLSDLFEALCHIDFEIAASAPVDVKFLLKYSISHAKVSVQPGGDLGCRLASVHRAASSDAIIIGSDCPFVGPQTIVDAAQRLLRHDLVLGPAEDGGYYLIGMKAEVNALALLGSGIRWSTQHALADTVANAQGLGLTMDQLPPFYDIDTAADLDRFREYLLSGSGGPEIAQRHPWCLKLAMETAGSEKMKGRR